MNAILPASLVALFNYYSILWRTPCFSISLLLFVGESRVLTACYKALKWIQRLILQQGSELGRITRRSGGGDSSTVEQRSHVDDEDNIDGIVDGDDEIRLLRDQSVRDRQKDVYAKWRTGEVYSTSNAMIHRQSTKHIIVPLADYCISHSSTLKVI